MTDRREQISQLNTIEWIRLYFKIKWLQTAKNKTFNTAIILSGRFFIIVLVTYTSWNQTKNLMAFFAMIFGAFAIALITVQYQRFFRKAL